MDLRFIKNRTIKFGKLLQDLIMIFFFFLLEKNERKGNKYKRDKYKEIFLTDLQNQFKIISNGKY